MIQKYFYVSANKHNTDAVPCFEFLRMSPLRTLVGRLCPLLADWLNMCMRSFDWLDMCMRSFDWPNKMEILIDPCWHANLA